MPTPIISAAAVDAVRRGLRTAFSLASVPLMPLSLGSGAPRSLATGFAITGPRMVAAANTTSALRPTWIAPLPPPFANPAKSNKTPRASATRPMITRLRDVADVSTATSRIAATGGMREARRAGNSAEATVMPTPTMRLTTTVRGSRTSEPLGRSIPSAPSSEVRPIATRTPSARPTTEAISPTATPSSEHRAEHLPSTRADRAKQRELAASLRDEDRERVVDDEHPDEDGDAGEHEQEDVEEPEALLDVVLVLLGDLLAREHLDVSRHHLRDVRRQLLLGHAGVGDRGDRVDLSGFGEQLLRGVVGEADERCAGRRVRGAELRDAADRELLRRSLEQDLHRLTDREVPLVRASLVDDDLVGARRGASLDDRPGVQLGHLAPAAADVGRLAGAERLAVGLDELRITLHRPFRRLHAFGALDGRHQGGGDATADVAEVALEDGLAADERVGATVHVREEVVEDLAHGVGEHERPRHERDAEHDCERGREQSQLLGQQAPDGDAPHVVASPRSASADRALDQRSAGASRRRSCRRRGRRRGSRAPPTWGRGSPSRSSARGR